LKRKPTAATTTEAQLLATGTPQRMKSRPHRCRRIVSLCRLFHGHRRNQVSLDLRPPKSPVLVMVVVVMVVV